MTDVAWRVMNFPGDLGSEGRRALRKDLLECAACVAGRDAKLIFVAGSPTIRALLEVSRIASVVPVCDSIEEAFTYPQIAAETIHVPADMKDMGAQH